MMWRLLLPTLGTLGGLIGLIGGATGSDSASVDQLVNEALRRWHVPGVAVVIVRDGRITHLKGYGAKRLGADAPVTPDTLFPLASCTKAFTSTLMAMLADDGKLAWDDPVRKHLPSFHLRDRNADELVTMRDLVTHRTGYAGVEHDLLWYHAPWDMDETLRRASRLPPDGQFRSSYHYSTILFMAAGKAAANRAGAPWEELVRARVCEPLGMKSVALTSDEAAKFPDRAAGHRRAKSGKIELMPPYRLTEPNPAGSLHTTARDLARWLKFQLADGVIDGKRLVSSANLNETKTPHTVMRKDETVGPVYPDSLQVSYAMGWVVYDHRGKLVVAHGGVADGFRAQITLLPKEKIGIALLNNLHQTKMNIALGNTLIDHLLGLPPKDWNAYFLKVEQDERDARQAAIDKRNRERRPNTRPSAPLSRFVGEYHDPAYGTGKVVLRKGRLVWEWSSFRCPLEHFQDDTFRISHGNFAGQLVTFRVEAGQPLAVRALGAVYVRKTPRTP